MIRRFLVSGLLLAILLVGNVAGFLILGTQAGASRDASIVSAGASMVRVGTNDTIWVRWDNPSGKNQELTFRLAGSLFYMEDSMAVSYKVGLRGSRKLVAVRGTAWTLTTTLRSGQSVYATVTGKRRSCPDALDWQITASTLNSRGETLEQVTQGLASCLNCV